MSVALIEKSIAGSLRVEPVTCADQLAELAEPWNRLAGDVPFRQWQWLATWWRHFRTDRDRLLVLAVHDDEDRLVGIAPWYVHRSAAFGQEIRFLGSGSVYSDYLTLLADADNARAVARCVADWLTDNPLAWDAVYFQRVDASDTTIDRMVDRLVITGHRIWRRACESCWRVEFPETWDDYVMRLSKSRRERVRKFLRRQFDTGRAVLHRVKTIEQFERGWEILTTLHARRRESLGQRDSFSSPQFAAFLHSAARQFLDRGDLRLQWVEIDGQPAAVEIDFAGNDTVYFYQCGMEPELADQRPGWLGTIAALKLAVEEGYDGYDFLGGDESYKSHWRATERPQYELRIAARRSPARQRHHLWTTKEQFKQWLKHRLNR